jgi:hypothetical protein
MMRAAVAPAACALMPAYASTGTDCQPSRRSRHQYLMIYIYDCASYNDNPAKEKGMPKVSISTDTAYMSAGWLRRQLGVTDHMLARMLTLTRIRSLTNAGKFPLYSVDDVKKWLKKEGYSDKELPSRTSAGTRAVRKQN